MIIIIAESRIIIELNELIYARAKLVCKKMGVPFKSMKKKAKPGWEIRLETQTKHDIPKQ